MGLVQIVVFADEYDGIVPKILLRQMLFEPLTDTVRFSDLGPALFSRIVRFSEQDIDPRVVQIGFVAALTDMGAGYAVGFSRPVGEFAADLTFRLAVHQKQGYLFAVDHIFHIFPKVQKNIEKGRVRPENAVAIVVRILRAG